MVDPVPEVFEPPGDTYEPYRQDWTTLFPDEAVSRWALALICAHNDLSIPVRLAASLLNNKRPDDPAHRYYRDSHVHYLIRMVVAHSVESWDAYRKIRKIEGTIVEAIRGEPKVIELEAGVSKLMDTKLEDGQELWRLLKHGRHQTFHYDSDPNADGWATMLAVNKDTPMTINPSSRQTWTDHRWIVGDVYLDSRLNYHSFWANQSLIGDAAFSLLALIRTSIDVYLKAREARS